VCDDFDILLLKRGVDRCDLMMDKIQLDEPLVRVILCGAEDARVEFACQLDKVRDSVRSVPVGQVPPGEKGRSIDEILCLGLVHKPKSDAATAHD